MPKNIFCTKTTLMILKILFSNLGCGFLYSQKPVKLKKWVSEVLGSILSIKTPEILFLPVIINLKMNGNMYQNTIFTLTKCVIEGLCRFRVLFINWKEANLLKTKQFVWAAYVKAQHRLLHNQRWGDLREEGLQTDRQPYCHRFQPSEPENFHIQEASSYCKQSLKRAWVTHHHRETEDKKIPFDPGPKNFLQPDPSSTPGWFVVFLLSRSRFQETVIYMT